MKNMNAKCASMDVEASVSSRMRAVALHFDSVLRLRMEKIFACDFSRVRLFESDWPSSFGAHALACGSEIHFAPGAFAPQTRGGLARLAHELTHVVQQAHGCLTRSGSVDTLYLDDALEAQAQKVGEWVADGLGARVSELIEKLRAEPAATVSPLQCVPQPQLVIEGAGPYTLIATNALRMLTGQIPNALVFTPIDEGTNVTKGAAYAAAQGLLPHTCTLLGRVIDSAHWATIRNGGNATTPAMWLKDRIWAALRGTGGFMTKVTTPGRGASCTITWDGGVAQTANYDVAQQHIVMGQVPNHITLAHELVHADRIGRGTFKTGSSRTWVVLHTHANRPNTHQSFINKGWRYEAGGAAWVGGAGGAWVMEDIMMVDDIANIGLQDRDNRTGIDALLVTENMVRQEFGIDLRVKYGLFGGSLV